MQMLIFDYKVKESKQYKRGIIMKKDSTSYIILSFRKECLNGTGKKKGDL